MLEFTNEWHKVTETQELFTVYVRRLYGYNGTVTVDYDMTMTEPAYARIDYLYGTLIFEDQVKEVGITFNVYPRCYYESSLDDVTFSISLHHPFGGAEIGY